jgi:hypothetical protein
MIQTKSHSSLVSLVVLIALLAFAGTATAQVYDAYSYFLMPQGLVAKTKNESFNGSYVTLVDGEYCFWRGTRWGRQVALEGDPSFTRYALFVETDTRLEFWGNFRGNDFHPGEISTAHGSPFYWMNRSVQVGDVMTNTVLVKDLSSDKRRITRSVNATMSLTIDAWYATWTNAGGKTFSDVLKVTYTSNTAAPQNKLVLYLAKGKGRVQYEVFSGGSRPFPRGWVVEHVTKAVSSPTLPWYGPFPTPVTFADFQNTTFVPNGWFEEMIQPPVQGGPVSTYLRSWQGSSQDVVITTDAPRNGLSPWKISLRGASPGLGGDGLADAAITRSWIPVTPGRIYRLSGWLLRGETSDNVYLDFNDGQGYGGGFTDGQAMARSTHVWEFQSVDVRVGPTTRGIRIRCVRDGANLGNGYCDGVMLQRVD